ncbi:metalloregulator ArsR/SmtB family transcription factor [Alteromonas facilis]|uniref:metalloregulator ArsR/SmtB family transcription factor n=1 Tax=Alteromonas facilis TaxID=2048004 RepID=UPI001F0C9478|nr:metalloregulator ArsR/SmtB family transcription factor [Alteromonas facilis]
MSPLPFFKSLADETRLLIVLLINNVGEACVCELMLALAMEQPKISRHLAELRKAGVVLGERRGKWVYYYINPSLPDWAKEVVHNTAVNNIAFYSSALQALENAKQAQTICQ